MFPFEESCESGERDEDHRHFILGDSPFYPDIIVSTSFPLGESRNNGTSFVGAVRMTKYDEREDVRNVLLPEETKHMMLCWRNG